MTGVLSWGDIVAIFGSIATIIGGLRWLLGVYFRQQAHIDALRKKVFAAETDRLNGELQKFREEMQSVKIDMDKMMTRLGEILTQFNASKELQERIYAGFREFVVATKERFAKLEQENGLEKVQTGQVVGTVTPPGAAPTQNLGKVKVKP